MSKEPSGEIYIQGPAFSAGQARSLDYLLARGLLSQKSYEDCRDRGLTTVCVGQRPITQVCNTAIQRSLRGAGLRADEVDCVIVAVSTPHTSYSEEDYRGIDLDRVGLRCKIVTLQKHECTAFSVGVEVAIEHIHWHAMNNVLVLVVGHTPAHMDRYNAEVGTAFGDGAAACIVSTKRVGFAVIEARTLNEQFVAAAEGVNEGDSEQLLRRLKELHALFSTAFETAGIAPDSVAAILCTHGGHLFFELIADAAGVSFEKVYVRAMRRYGHIYACDNVIALVDFKQRKKSSNGRVLCLVGWGRRSAGIVILEER